MAVELLGNSRISKMASADKVYTIHSYISTKTQSNYASEDVNKIIFCFVFPNFVFMILLFLGLKKNY